MELQGAIGSGDFLLISTSLIQLIRNIFTIAHCLPETYDLTGRIHDSLDMLIIPRVFRDKPGPGTWKSRTQAR